MHTTVSSKGQIVLPAELRKRDGIEAGQEFEVERIDKGEYLLRRKTGRARKGLVDWLLACPEKDWVKALDRGENTDGIKSPQLE